MVHGDRTDQVHNEKDIKQGPLPAATNMLCAHLSFIDELVCSANPSITSRRGMRFGYSSVVVYMVRGNHHSVNIHLATTGEGKGFGVNRGVKQMSNPLSHSK
jgi:hypothetical protein